MKDEGALSVEAIAALLVLAALISGLPMPMAQDARQLLAMQQASDLLTVWAQRPVTGQQMQKDGELLLGKGNFIAGIGLEHAKRDGSGKNSISREILIREGDDEKALSLIVLEH